MQFERTSLDAFIDLAGKYPLLSREEETALLRNIRTKGGAVCREVVDKLILSNLRLVVTISKDFRHSTLPQNDIILEGVIGLQKAVERFIPAKGSKLSTYASWWIKQYMRRYIYEHGRTVRIPVHACEKIIAYNRVKSRLTEELHRAPTVYEIVDATGVSEKQIERLVRMDASCVTLDAPLGEDADSMTLGDIIPDERSGGADTDAEFRSDIALIKEILASYPKREREIVSLRLGLDGGKPMTLERLGLRFKITRERIRQIQRNVLTSVRNSIDRQDGIAGGGFLAQSIMRV